MFFWNVNMNSSVLGLKLHEVPFSDTFFKSMLPKLRGTFLQSAVSSTKSIKRSPSTQMPSLLGYGYMATSEFT